MEEKKNTLTREVEETMACSAFAEEGEPCPLGTGKSTDAPTAETATGEKKSAVEVIEDTMACSAFAEEGEPCPLGQGKTPEPDTKK